MFGMNSTDTRMVLVIGIVSVCLLLNYVSRYIRDARVAKYLHAEAIAEEEDNAQGF